MNLLPMADLHTHPLIPMYYFRKNLSVPHRTAPFFPFHPYGTHIDLPKLKLSGVKILVSCVYAWNRLPKASCFEVAQDQINMFHRWIQKHPETLVHVKNFQELENTIHSEKIAVLLALEGGHHLSNDLENLDYFRKQGVFYITIVHFLNTRVAASCHAVSFTNEEGLRPFGKELIQRMTEKNIFIDVAHCSEKAFWDVCEKSQTPLLYTHGGSAAQCSSVRNLSDEQSLAIAKSGGLLGTIFFPAFLSPQRWTAHIDDVRRHLDHWLSLVGPETLAIGTDMNGAMMLKDVSDYSRMPYFQEMMVQYYGEALARKILFENTYTFLKKNWK